MSKTRRSLRDALRAEPASVALAALLSGAWCSALALACGSEVSVYLPGVHTQSGGSAAAPTGGAAGAGGLVGAGGTVVTSGGAGGHGGFIACTSAVDCLGGALACRRVCDNGLCAEGLSPVGTPCDQCGGDQCDGEGWCVKSDVCEDPECPWARNFGDNGRQLGLGLATDLDGTVFLSGLFDGNVTFGGEWLASAPNAEAGHYDGFVASFAATGAHRWSLSFGSTGADSAEAVATTPEGDLLVAGFFEQSVSIAGGSLASVGGQDGMVAKLDGAGSLVWAISVGGPGNEVLADVAVHEDGSSVVVGHFDGTVAIGGTSLVSAGGRDVIVAQLDPTGAVRWARRFGGAGHDLGMRVAVGADGSSVVAGGFEEAVSFGGAALESSGAQDAFVLRLSSSGEHLYSARFGGVGYERVGDVAVGPNGEVALTGKATEPPQIEGDPACASAVRGAYWLVLEPEGGLRWSRCVGAGGSDPLAGVAVAFDAVGELYVAGVCVGASALGHCVSQGIFLHRYSPEGEELLGINLDGDHNQLATNMALDPWDHVFLTGAFLQPFRVGNELLDGCAFDTPPLEPAGEDVFLAKLVFSEEQ